MLSDATALTLIGSKMRRAISAFWGQNLQKEKKESLDLTNTHAL
jgi:hypothetical protein